MLCSRSECTGCLACYNVCNMDAIQLHVDKEGFSCPEIDYRKCISCGKCTKSCPIVNIKQIEFYDPAKVLAVWNKNKLIRDKSSSGGIFTILAEEVLKNGGTVYGAAYDENLVVHHIRIDSINQLASLQGSKYVQSAIENNYQKVKQDLDTRFVLFSGTPCQIAGLYQCIGHKHKNLLTVELLCHGVPSPGVFHSHIEYISKQFNKKVCNINFRKKTDICPQNLEFKFEDGTSYSTKEPMTDYYYSGFLSGITLRECCYKCRFIGTPRCADITLGDFWGIQKTEFKLPDSTTFISLVFLNSKKGLSEWDKVKDNSDSTERTINEAKEGNLCLRRHIPKNRKRGPFFKNYSVETYAKIAPKYLSVHTGWKDFIKNLLGPGVTKKMLKLLKR